MRSENVEISVIMATYNPVWEKCVFTLDSVIGQKNVDLELVITDDGSENNLFDEIKSYLNSRNFHNYRLVSHDRNHGTVCNYFDGLSKACGQYVKLISPGDALFGETTLEKWLQFLKEDGAEWSFAEAVYYMIVKNKRTPIKEASAPRLIDCYLSNNEKQCRWNYVVLEDMPLGAAILCKRQKLLQYMEKLVGIVKFSEDTSHTAMVYDDLLPAYYPTSVIFYEFGSGISTGDQKWIHIFQEDLRNFEGTLIHRENTDPFQRKMSKALASINSGGRRKKRLLKFLQKNGVKKFLKFRLAPRLSSSDCTGAGPWWKTHNSIEKAMEIKL